MASSSSVFGDLFVGQSGEQTQALPQCNFTIARTSSSLQQVGDTDDEMVIPEKHRVTVPAWLSYIYSEVHKEIEYLGNVFLDIQMGIQYLALSLKQRTQEVGNELLSRINMATAVSAAQMQRIDKWITSGKNAQAALRLQMEADK